MPSTKPGGESGIPERSPGTSHTLSGFWITMTDDAYRPIACSLHDRLEILALRGRPVTLRVREPDGGVRELEDRVVDWVARDGAEWVVTGGGEEIRLDRLVAVDGVVFGEG